MEAPQSDAQRDSFFKSLLVSYAVLRLALRGASEPIEPNETHFALLAHQLICMSVRGVSADDAFANLRNAWSFRAVTRSEFDQLLAHLVTDGYLRTVDRLIAFGPTAEKHYAFRHFSELYAVFEGERIYTVKNGRTEIGTVSPTFARQKEPPFLMTLMGRFWRAIDRDDRRRVLMVERAQTARTPRWISYAEGEVSRLAAQEVRRIVLGGIAGDPIGLSQGARELLLAAPAAIELAQTQTESFQVHATDRSAVVWTYGGTRDNQLLAHAIQRLAPDLSVISDPFCVEITPLSSTDAEARANEAMAALAALGAADAWTVSMQCAAMLDLPTATKFDGLVPEQLRLIERARSVANIERMRERIGIRLH